VAESSVALPPVSRESRRARKYKQRDMLEAERVNDFETPGVMRLVSKRV
jgi:hypothetical protein